VKTYGAEAAKNMAIAERANQLALKQLAAGEEERHQRGKAEAGVRATTGTRRNNG